MAFAVLATVLFGGATPWQMKLLASVGKASSDRAAESTEALIRRLDAQDVQDALRSCCPSVAGLDGRELLHKIRDEVSVAEVVSCFAARSPGSGSHALPFWYGPSVDEAAAAGELDNLWTVWYRKGWKSPNITNMVTALDDIETVYYGFKPFTRRSRPSSINETSERGAYALLNLMHDDAGSPLYGDVSLVLSPSIAAASLLSAFDSGSWLSMCNTTDSPYAHIYAHDCGAFGGHSSLGTVNHFEHLLLANERYWSMANVSARDASARAASERNVLPPLYVSRRDNVPPSALIRKLVRLFAPPERRPPLHGVDLIRYIEAVPATTVKFAADVTFVIGDVSSLFGAAIGQALRKWCVQQGWALVWALGLNLGPIQGPRFWDAASFMPAESQLSYGRTIDPVVGAAVGLNVPFTRADCSTFEDEWQRASVLQLRDEPFDPAEWRTLWGRTRTRVSKATRLRGMRADDARVCSLERCIGVSAQGDVCVCYR